MMRLKMINQIYWIIWYSDAEFPALQEYIKMHKVILIGDCRVGKTSFLHYIINNRTTSTFHNVPPTIGVEYTPTKVRIRG